MDVNISPSWKILLQTEFNKLYFEQIVLFLKTEKKAGKIIYPAGENIFKAFDTTPFDNVKVVILGQDPYHGSNQAHGLSFSVLNGVKIPPSLQNIFKELQTDIGIKMPPNFGDLTHWAKQGVLLLNSTLTVRDGEAGSHSKLGWERFTDEVIKLISDKKENIIFLLWGKFAEQKAHLINRDAHFILTAPHPSPLSVHRGFFGCKHFSQTNEILMKLGKQPIDWQLNSNQ